MKVRVYKDEWYRTWLSKAVGDEVLDQVEDIPSEVTIPYFAAKAQFERALTKLDQYLRDKVAR